MILKNLFAMGALATILGTSLHAQIIPDSRLTNWNPGVPDGIPDITANIVNAVSDFSAVNDSSADASVAIQNAMNSLNSSGGVIYLPEGKYRLDSQLTFNGDNIVIRGAGSDKTKLYSSYDGSSIAIINYNRGDYQNIISGATKGSKSIIVTDGSKFTIGQFAELQQDNDSDLMYTSSEWDQDWAANAVGQLFEVIAIDGNTINFRNPIHYEVRMDLNPQIRPQGFRKYCGIEDLYIEKPTVVNGYTIEIKNAANSWVRRIESNMTRKAHINFTTSIGIEIRENLFHHSWNYGGGGSGYGTELGMHTTDCLVEDNIFYHLRHAMMVHVGAIGNVFGYNYSFEAVQAEGGDELELNVGWDPPDISLHGHWAQYNLFEANKVVEVGIGDYWGPMGPGNTFLRNVVDGGQSGIAIIDASVDQNLIGNVADALNDDGNATGTITHGNDFGSGTQWDASISDHDIPISYYLNSKPWFWGTQSWPVTGTDYSGSEMIPAQKRWLAGSPFALDTGSITLNIKSSLKTELFNLQQNNKQLIISFNNFNNKAISVKLIGMNGEIVLSKETTNNELTIDLPTGINLLKINNETRLVSSY